jgi:excisionase family DNA binding protein
MKKPETLVEFIAYLKHWHGRIESWSKHPDGVHEDELRGCADIAYEAELLAHELGLQELPAQRYVNLPHREAQAILMRLLVASQNKPIDDVNAQLSVAQAAKRINVAVGTIYDLVQRNQIAHKRYGTGRGTIRIRLGDLLDYSKKQTIAAKQAGVTLEQLLKA